jgi:hypothetical protein
VPSDLEQMPNLLNFIEQHGTLLANHHTPLLAHTATDILTALTGLYPDRMGVPVANSFGYFNPDGSDSLASAFGYWTASVSATHPVFNMLTAPNTNAPAPWVPFTRNGCNVGGVGTANIELENTRADITTVFGAASQQAQEAASNPTKANADFVGIAVHCATSSTTCSSANGGVSDVLPDEPGGYSGFSGLFGHKYVAPQISPNGPLTDLNGNVIAGFPGFDAMSPAVSLAYVAAMQEHGVPVTYAYVSDAHDNHGGIGTFGPGEAGYVAQLKAYDDAFGKFFARLQSDGITDRNTVFVITSDENDHFAGVQDQGCDGVTVPCTYTHDGANPTIGEVNINLTGLLATQQGNTTPFDVHFDSSPTVYVKGNLSQTDPLTRGLERAMGAAHITDPYTGQDTLVANVLADQVEMKLLHMVTADPARTETFTLFGQPDLFIQTGVPNCGKPCVAINSGFAWIHGTIAPDINTTWLGMVGPGVRNLGVDRRTWSDHVDIRPTIMSLTGLTDDYRSDGRVLTELLQPEARARRGEGQVRHYEDLAAAYKRINAPVGELSQLSWKISTAALKSNASGDSTFNDLESQLTTFTNRRDALAARMIAVLDAAAFQRRAINEDEVKRLVDEAQDLINDVRAVANGL